MRRQRNVSVQLYENIAGRGTVCLQYTEGISGITGDKTTFDVLTMTDYSLVKD